MANNDIEKFRYWAEKVDSLIKRNDKAALNYLPTASLWLAYRAKKVREDPPILRCDWFFCFAEILSYFG